MKMAAIGALGLVLTVTTLGQSTEPAKLKINGIGLDSTLAKVKKVLGKPVKEGKAANEECAGGREKEVTWSGASFHFMDAIDPRTKAFQVVSFEITSPKYIVSGIKIGDTEHNVRRHLGTNFTRTRDDETRADVWMYEFTDPESPGITNVYMVRGKVVKITSAYQVC